MPDLIRIRGDVAAVRSLTDLTTLEIIDETATFVDASNIAVSAFADAATQAAIAERGLTVTIVKTEAQYEADLQKAYDAINEVPYNFGGNV
jgi:hypothetical protein